MRHYAQCCSDENVETNRLWEHRLSAALEKTGAARCWRSQFNRTAMPKGLRVIYAESALRQRPVCVIRCEHFLVCACRSVLPV